MVHHVWHWLNESTVADLWTSVLASFMVMFMVAFTHIRSRRHREQQTAEIKQHMTDLQGETSGTQAPA